MNRLFIYIYESNYIHDEMNIENIINEFKNSNDKSIIILLLNNDVTFLFDIKKRCNI